MCNAIYYLMIKIKFTEKHFIILITNNYFLSCFKTFTFKYIKYKSFMKYENKCTNKGNIL